MGQYSYNNFKREFNDLAKQPLRECSRSDIAKYLIMKDELDWCEDGNYDIDRGIWYSNFLMDAVDVLEQSIYDNVNDILSDSPIHDIEYEDEW